MSVPKSPTVRLLKAGVVYFALVFAVGFLLGPIRVLWAAPKFGARTAELMEAPLMLAAILLAARWVTKRVAAPSDARGRLFVGTVALALILFAEFTVVLWVRGWTLQEYWTNREPVAGGVYGFLLAAFALAPVIVSR